MDLVCHIDLARQRCGQRDQHVGVAGIGGDHIGHAGKHDGKADDAAQRT